MSVDSKYHIELDGEGYRLAQDSQGQHHSILGEPLRPPNSVTVQGLTQQTFQLRPDLVVWRISDWSGGEGQRTFDPQNPSRHWELNRVRAFEEPGHLIPGFYVEVTQNDLGGDEQETMTLVSGVDKLYGLDQDTGIVHIWDDTLEEWAAPGTNLAGVTNGAQVNAVGDNDGVYWIERSSTNVWSWDGSAAPVQLSTGVITSGANLIEQLGPYVYVYRPASGKVWEIPKSGATNGEEIDTWTESGKFPRGDVGIVALDGRIYVMVSARDKTSIREIVPTTAAGPGYGAEIARIQGFEGSALWAHSGSLFILGRYEETDQNRTILYLQPGGEYGTLGQIRPGVTMNRGTGGTGRMLDHFWVQQRLNGTDVNHAVFQIDAVTGGLACVAYDETGDATGEIPIAVIGHRGEIWWSVSTGSTNKRVMRAQPSLYQSDASAITPEHDFDLASAKYLGSLVLSTEPMPADWTVYVDYQKDNDGTWNTGITYSTTSGTGVTTAISTDSTTDEFNTLQLRIRFEYTGAGTPSTAPVVLAVEARAAVSNKVRLWELLLDLSDDHSAGKASESGSDKVDKFLASAIKATVLSYKDGYTSRKGGEFTEYDVTVDSYRVLLDRPGEGVGFIVLREVV